MTKVQVQNIAKMAGGKLITRKHHHMEATVPYHALSISIMAFTSHVMYMAGGNRESMMKYNMKYVKTLPVTWLPFSFKKIILVC